MPVSNVCPNCAGTGWKIVEREEVSGAERCECVQADRALRLDAEAGLPPLYADKSFENFLLPRDNPATDGMLTAVFMKVRGYALEFPNTKQPGLLLMGYPGCGKTLLAVAALRALMAKGFAGLFFDYQNLLDRIRSSYDTASGASDRTVYRDAMEADILLLDDLGAQRILPWAEDTVTAIITTRCNERRPFIAT